MAFRWTSARATRQGRPMLALLALIVGWCTSVPAQAAAIRSVAVSGGRVVIGFDGPVGDATAVLLHDSRQIAIDIAQAIPGAQALGGGLVTRVRQWRAGQGTRLLLDLGRPAVIGDGGFDAAGRLTVSLEPADPARVAAAVAAGPLRFFTMDLGQWRARPRYKLSIPVPPPARRAPLPEVTGDASRPLVVIDAGHGGVDPGAINPVTGLREKDVTLAIARTIRDALLASGRVRVALTRDDDRFLVLRERYGVARRLKASLFISIHCDSVGSGDASGASVYTLSEVASDKEAARLAMRENKADVIAGVNLGDAGADVSSILIDLAQRETMNSSASFARLLGREAKPLIPTKPVFHRMASLMVLKAPDLPSILFETGYISNPVDAAFLDSKEGRERIADSVTKAVEVHFARQLAGR
ncbi:MULTISPECIES: N-acetylmuramoyl-L-alanine amidase family protein [Sphingomonas]|uniref:N-acetylmuramoyl-L-alanine amidase n=1 Tax=Sphingomonas kyungheensis TaxID=1069987 RepID=A0ABU8GYK9_9SPHN|nr:MULTISPECIES: N-acetylmuramoyl-L-alanine amidase [unclassified Sphingomonas]EZP55371.1 N-acetylmuramoyl-L-alanine amidase family protein [Sphingomonas sp. RIT328]